MFQGNLPVSFWGECALSAAYLINHTPSFLLHHKSPFEILFPQEPDYNELKVFGCLYFAYDHKSKQDKFTPQSRRCLFVAYSNTKKGWKLYDVATGDFFYSRDVQFFGYIFPFSTLASTSSNPNSFPTHSSPLPITSAPDFLDGTASPIQHNKFTFPSSPSTAPAEPPSPAEPTTPDESTSPVEPTSPLAQHSPSSPPTWAASPATPLNEQAYDAGLDASHALGSGMREKRPSVLL